MAFLLSLRPHMIKTAKQDKTRWSKGAAAACLLALLLLLLDRPCEWVSVGKGCEVAGGGGG